MVTLVANKAVMKASAEHSSTKATCGMKDDEKAIQREADGGNRFGFHKDKVGSCRGTAN